MSDTAKSTEQRTPYSIEIDPKDCVAFEPVFSGRFLTSAELLRLVNDIMYSAFADYNGSKFITTNMGNVKVATIELYFDHNDHSNDALPCACSRAEGKTVGNNVLDRTRSRDRARRDGDRYIITEDGKDVISKLLNSRFYNRGKINWGSVVAEATDFGANRFTQQAVQITKIQFIDPRKLLRLIYGGKDENGGNVDYDFTIAADLTPQNNFQQYASAAASHNYLLSITKASEENIKKAYNALGIGYADSGISRER